MKRALLRSNLDHYTLISPRLMLAFFRPHTINYTTLLPIGSAILIESKRELIFNWYFQMLPALLAGKFITCVTPLYVDTGK